MGANTRAIAAVNESAFRDVEWTTQAASQTATTSAPSTATDGVSLGDRSAFGFQVVEVSGTASATIVLWGYANGAWGKIPDGEYTVSAGGLIEATTIGGILERVYVQISAYTSGTLTLNVGVPKP